MLSRLLCLLGRHVWRHADVLCEADPGWRVTHRAGRRECRHCGRVEERVFLERWRRA